MRWGHAGRVRRADRRRALRRIASAGPGAPPDVEGTEPDAAAEPGDAPREPR